VASIFKTKRSDGKIAASMVFTVEEVARYLHVHQSTIYRLVRQKELPAFKVGSDWRFNIESIESAGFFVQPTGMTFSRAKNKDDDTASAQIQYGTSRAHGARVGGVLAGPSEHGLSAAQGTEAALIPGARGQLFLWS
jgi:excisionase family DNA binding protein